MVNSCSVNAATSEVPKQVWTGLWFIYIYTSVSYKSVLSNYITGNNG